jgi:hypothetical protein
LKRVAAELRDGADVALIVKGGVELTAADFVGLRGSLKAGHAAERQCSADLMEE